MTRPALLILAIAVIGCESRVAEQAAPEKPAEPKAAKAGPLLAGAAKVDITHPTAMAINDRLYARALVVKSGETSAVIVSIDAVAIGEIGAIRNDFLSKVRERVERELSIPGSSLIVNASHCHGTVCADIEDKTFEAVKLAAKNLVPVKAGVGSGSENRIMENRRLKLKSGREADVRHAYALPPDEEVESVGPVDPQIGLLRLDKADGKTLAVVYNFACHPIMGVPGGENTADITGFASKVIEDNLSEGAVALFLQGCGGDINPIGYKDVHNPRHAEPLGNMLGLSTLQGLKKIACTESAPLKVINEKLSLPRADLTERIDMLQADQAKLLKSLQGTSLNLKTFLPLAVKYDLSADFPSFSSHRYLHEKKLGREEAAAMDAVNRKNLKAYIDNIHAMEALTRNQTNLALLKKHQEANLAAGRKPIEVEVVALRIGEFVLITFPGELVVEIGLGIKKSSPHKHTFVAGYTNGYIYYCPTAEQLKNRGRAQEDSDCRLAPEWQKLFEAKVAEMLKRI